MNRENPSPAVQRAILCAELRRLRTNRAETQEEVATACEWSLAKFSRIETGISSIKKTDLQALLRYYDVAEDHINELIHCAREARAPGWWEDYSFGADRDFEAYVGYEDGASSIRMWQPLVVPALLQVPQYTAQTMEAWGVSAEAIARGVKLREERQRRIAVRSPVQYYLLDEAVIRRSVGSAMPDQMRHLSRVAQKPAVTIRIVPFRCGPHFGLRGPFVLLSFDAPLDDVLYLESARRGNVLIAKTRDRYIDARVPEVEDPSEEIARYQDGFMSLLKLALEPAESLELIEAVAAEGGEWP
jgi:transcriptional regulator with XRE-family HTH domain